jgi:hypothetical protein
MLRTARFRGGVRMRYRVRAKGRAQEGNRGGTDLPEIYPPAIMKRTRKSKKGRGVVGTGVEGVVYDNVTSNPQDVPAGLPWPDDQVLKVYYSRDNADREWNLSQSLRSLDLPGALLPTERIDLLDGNVALLFPYGGKDLHHVDYARDGDRLQHSMHQFINDIETWNRQGLYHNDLHPGNLVFDGERIRAIDWGYADGAGASTKKPVKHKGHDRDLKSYAETVNDILFRIRESRKKKT